MGRVVLGMAALAAAAGLAVVATASPRFFMVWHGIDQPDALAIQAGMIGPLAGVLFGLGLWLIVRPRA